VAFDELKARSAAAWSSAPWEEAEHLIGEVHERLVAALDPRPGERWLDVGTGAGAVALLIARRGADTTGIDPAYGLIESAKRRAADEGLDVAFDVGDAESLPYEDASFDGVASSMGMIFAPSHEAAAGEVARVLRPGGRLGFTAWRPETAFFAITRKYAPPPPEDAGNPDDWSREAYVEKMLGDSFELTFQVLTMTFLAESGDAAWELMSRTVGPFKAGVTMLEPEQLAEFHREFVELLDAHRANGGVELPGEYLLVVGTRR
jgi:ubiquinone/menaquinone biosynthesis C-methylase UbiE